LCQTYVLLNQGSSRDNLSRKLPDFIKKYSDSSNTILKINLQPLKRIHLYSNADFQINSDGNIVYVILLLLIALFIILISCFNYIGLTIARSIKRLKETAVKKLFGATLKQIIYQHLIEGIIYVLSALMIALLIFYFTLPILDKITHNEFSHTPLNIGKPYCSLLPLSFL